MRNVQDNIVGILSLVQLCLVIGGVVLFFVARLPIAFFNIAQDYVKKSDTESIFHPVWEQRLKKERKGGAW